MSVRVEFWRGRRDGIESAFLESLPAFRQWYADLVSDPASGFSPAVLETIDLIQAQGRSALLPTSIPQAAKLDETLDAFIGDFCDWGPGKGLFPPLNESMLSKQHYASLLGVVEMSDSQALIRFWGFLLHGRPLARDADRFPYQPSDEVFRVSFLTASEAVLLREPLVALYSRHGSNLVESEVAALDRTAQAVLRVMQRGTGLVATAA